MRITAFMPGRIPFPPQAIFASPLPLLVEADFPRLPKVEHVPHPHPQALPASLKVMIYLSKRAELPLNAILI
jgi:hypothetical protein